MDPLVFGVVGLREDIVVLEQLRAVHLTQIRGEFVPALTNPTK